MARALIIIDMQNEFCRTEDGLLVEHINELIEPINNLAERFRLKDESIFWVNWGVDSELSGLSKSQKEKFNNFEYPKELHWKQEKNCSKKVLEKGSWSAQIIDELNSDDKDTFIPKQRMSGFWDTELESMLKECDITDLYFAGVNTDQCVLSTLQDAHFAGFNCFLVKDCTGTSSPDFCLKSTLYNVEKCFGKVISSENCVF